MRVAALLGAGFSKWSCGLPLVSELFDFAISADNPIEERRISRLQKKYDAWKTTNQKSNNEAFIEFSQGPSGKFSLINWYVTRRLTEPFVVGHGRRFTWYINSYFPAQHKGVENARNLLHALLQNAGSGSLGILTTNYDLLVEYALGTRAFNYGTLGEQIGFTPYPYPRPIYVTGNIPIAKLHGSISWNEDRKFPDSRCGLTGKCLIVPPISEKAAPKLLRDQWKTAKSILSACDKLVVFGFAFNDYDTAIRNFIAKALRPKSTVILVDTVDHRKRLSKLLKKHDMKFVQVLEPNLIERVSAAVTS